MSYMYDSSKSMSSSSHRNMSSAYQYESSQQALQSAALKSAGLQSGKSFHSGSMGAQNMQQQRQSSAHQSSNNGNNYQQTNQTSAVSVNVNVTHFEGYAPQEPPPVDITNLQLPAPNMSCYQEPPTPKGEVRYMKHEEAGISKTITQNFNAVKTVVKENTIHHQHCKTVVTNVNRNHWHTQRIVVKDNHFHHHLVNNVIKVNDVHHQKIEQVRGEGKTFNDFKQTQRIEAAQCLRENDTQQAEPDMCQ